MTPEKAELMPCQAELQRLHYECISAARRDQAAFGSPDKALREKFEEAYLVADRAFTAAVAALSPAAQAAMPQIADGSCQTCHGTKVVYFYGADNSSRPRPCPVCQSHVTPDKETLHAMRDSIAAHLRAAQAASDAPGVDLLKLAESWVGWQALYARSGKDDDGHRASSAEAAFKAALRLTQAKVAALFDAIAHGNEEHRAWLKQAIEDHFAGRPIERVRGTNAQAAKAEDMERVARERAHTIVKSILNDGGYIEDNARFELVERIAAALAQASTPPGYVCVPREPDE